MEFMTKEHTYLTPGPSQLYFTVEDHLKNALKERVPSISHRDAQFQQIVKHTTTQLRKLMNIPEEYYIVFTASATEVWERIIENLVQETSYHFVNGVFSKRFYDTAVALNRSPVRYEVELGQGFDLQKVKIPEVTELIALTINETSTGVAMPLEQIAELRAKYADKLIAVDAVSAMPFPAVNFLHLDTLFYSVQKCFGLPSGLGVWIFNSRCVEKANQLSQSQSIGFHHSIPSFIKRAQQDQTPCTPNMLNIYLLGKIAEDMNRRSIDHIRSETNYKAALIYNALAGNPKFKVFVKDTHVQSKTIIVADVVSGDNTTFLESCEMAGIVLGTGYGELKKRQIRIANFPTHSKEIFESLADVIKNF